MSRDLPLLQHNALSSPLVHVITSTHLDVCLWIYKYVYALLIDCQEGEKMKSLGGVS